MSYPTLVLGESGTGKTASLRNFNPANTLLIQCLAKPLPFKQKGWGVHSKENPSGNMLVYQHSDEIINAMNKTGRSIIVVDDFQYLMVNEFMRRANESQFQKFTDIASHAHNVLLAARDLAPSKRVYLLSHSFTDEAGKTRAKTVGRLVDEKIVLEGMFTIVLRTVVEGGTYQFATRNNGSDTVKTPMGLFGDEELIPNDLAAVDAAICEYYGIADGEKAQTQPIARKRQRINANASDSVNDSAPAPAG